MFKSFFSFIGSLVGALVGIQPPSVAPVVNSGTVYGPVDQFTIDAQALPLARALVMQREGVRNTAYIDTEGYLTGGVGHKITAADGKWKVGDHISDAKLSAWFSKDLSGSFAAAKAQAILLRKYTPAFIAALVSVNFQLGTGWRSKFPNTWAALVRGDYRDAINRINQSEWARQTPVRVADFVGSIRTAYMNIA